MVQDMRRRRRVGIRESTARATGECRKYLMAMRGTSSTTGRAVELDGQPSGPRAENAGTQLGIETCLARSSRLSHGRDASPAEIWIYQGTV